MTVQWIEKKAPVEWLGAPKLGVGALPFMETAQAKGLLASWNTTDGNQCINQYGLNPEDITPSWGNRDGWVLACFAKWWNVSGKLPKLPEPTGNIAWVDLDQQHLSALQQWGVSKGVINPGQIPVPPGQETAACAQNCQNKYLLDPVNLATCLSLCAGAPVIPPSPTTPDYTACAQNCINVNGLDPVNVADCLKNCAGVSPGTLPPPPPPPPGTTPPVTPPPGTPPPTNAPTKTEEKKSVLPWVLGGAALLGLGALWFGKTPVTLLANQARERVRGYLVRHRLNSGGYDSRGRYFGLGQPLYMYEIADERGRYIKSDFVRADNREHAKDVIRRRMGSGYDVRFTR